ncbi:hypothetical protein [Legionella maioricensis]|uniref:Uncharacterized protein n=1 Tax=Legionella maioricensis TaxID=2896528 RepID=A0A9X2D146_9GAMM|nr:hypothetical protein [Legionella maioricensis]MCL9684210.1 hypothetical protein [Legionella maioricensis]MCL9687076.1 hypothetical protein [Legionella maioricensis]
MFNKTESPAHNATAQSSHHGVDLDAILMKLSNPEQKVLKQIQKLLDDLMLSNNLPSKFDLTIEDFGWPKNDYLVEISSDAFKALIALVFSSLPSLPVSLTLSLAHCPIGDSGAEQIAEIITSARNCANLTIDLFNCGIGVKGFTAIANALASGQCRLSPLTLELGQQHWDGEDEPGWDDNVDGQIQLVEVIRSPQCPKDLVINFNYLTEEYAEKIVTAMRLNTTCTIKFQNIDSPYVKNVVFLNERNRLLKKYPAYKGKIISFCHEQTTTDSTPKAFGLYLSAKSSDFDEQNTPSEIVQFFLNSLYCAPGADGTEVLTIREDSENKQDKIADLQSLYLAIKNNTEFTAFIKPKISICKIEMRNLMLLLTTTALRNQLIKKLKIATNSEVLLDIGQFNFQLLLTLHHKKSGISQEVKELCTEYVTCVLTDEINCTTFEDGIEVDQKKHSYFAMAVKTGIIPVARQLYSKFTNQQFFYDEDDFYGEELYISAIKSESEEMMVWLNGIMPAEKKFICRETIESIAGNLEKENLSKGLVILKKLVDDCEKNMLEELIRRKNADQLSFFLSRMEVCKATLTEFMSIAASSSANKAVLEVLIDRLGENFDVNIIPVTDFLYLTSLNTLSDEQIHDFLIHHYSLFSKEQALQLIRQKHCPEQFILQFIELHLNSLTSEHLSFIAQDYELSLELIEVLLKLSPDQLVKNDFIQSLYLKLPENQKIRSTILSEEVSELILKGNSIAALSLLMAVGFNQNKIETIAINKRLDFISVLLIAASYPNSQIGNDNLVAMLKQVLSQNYFPLNDRHLALAQKLNNKDVYVFLSNEFHGDRVPVPSKQLDAVKFFQGAIRTHNRIATLYSTMFNSPENSYLFWLSDKSKERMDGDKLEKNIWKYMAFYTRHHAVEMVNGPVLCFLSPYSFQHIKEARNLDNILNCSYLLSEKARSDMDMPTFSTLIQDYDRKIQDNQLVCTAPFELYNDKGLHYAKMRINLSKLPMPYLQHCIIKMLDYVARDHASFKKIEIAPSIFMTLLRQANENRTESSYQFDYYAPAVEPQTYILTIPGENEIFHGFKGFKEALCHFLSVVNALPDTGDSKILKSKILEYFEQLHQEDKLNDHLDGIFKYLFKYMEIDFQRGLPFSLDYIETVFIRNGGELNFQLVLDLVQNGNINQFKRMLDEYPYILGKPIVIHAILKSVPAYYYHQVASVLEEKFPDAYLVCTKNMMELFHKNTHEMRQYVNEIARNQSITTDHSLLKLMQLLKTHLSKNHELRQSLIKSHQEDVNNLLLEVKKLYANIRHVGGNSKMNELFTNPQIMSLLTGKHNAVIAAIIALEIEAEIKSEPFCVNTLVTGTTSQQSMKSVTITLGSILFRAFNQPPFFMESCPLNSHDPNITYLEIDNLRNYAKHKVIFNHFYNELEKGMLALCNTYGIPQENVDDCIANADGCYASYCIDRWEEYEDQLTQVLGFIDQSFCGNLNIVDEVNHGLALLMKSLGISKVTSKSRQLPTLEQLVETLLSSTLILHPHIAHLLFDPTHFGVALTGGKKIDKIQLLDEEISFHHLIMACVNKISQTGVTPENAIMAEQLALRMKQLQFWCKENLPQEVVPTIETQTSLVL